jgi:hypothetical protein
MEPIEVVDMFEVVRDNLVVIGSRLPASSSPALPNLMVAPWRGAGLKTSSSRWAADSKVIFSAIVVVGSKCWWDVL